MPSSRSLPVVLLSSVLVAFAVACGAPKKPALAPASAGPTAPAEAIVVPPDPSPNVLRDRRGAPGVRVAAKPLVLDNARSVQCGRLKKRTEASELELLGGRLRLRAPSGAKVPDPPVDAPSTEEESRVVVEAAHVGEKERAKLALAVVARETFQLDPDLYEPEADSPAKPGSLDVEAAKFLKATFPSEEPLEISAVEIGGGPTKMRAYVARPPHPNAPPGKDTALVMALLVAQDDGALESLGFYVRGETVRNATGSDLVGCTRLAERIASSLTPGPRKLERAPGRRHVADVSADRELAVTVPADYVAVPPGPPGSGKSGVRLTKMRPLSLYAGSIVVSVEVGAGAPVPEGADATAPGTLLGRAMEWHGKTTPRGGFFFAAEPLDPDDTGGKDKAKTAAVLVKATRQEKALTEMRTVAETLAVVKRVAR